jgi:DNA end-binding protein Ku
VPDAHSSETLVPACDREAPNSETVKGYEFDKGRYVVLSEEDFEKVRPESTRVIDRAVR